MLIPVTPTIMSWTAYQTTFGSDPSLCETLTQLHIAWEESTVQLGFQNCFVKFKFHLKMIRKKKESAPLKIEAISPANFHRARS